VSEKSASEYGRTLSITFERCPQGLYLLGRKCEGRRVILEVSKPRWGRILQKCSSSPRRGQLAAVSKPDTKNVEIKQMQRLLEHCTRDIATTGCPTSTSARSAPCLLRARDSQPQCGCNSDQVQDQLSSLESELRNQRYLRNCS
jgi:hypothetical protein